MTSKDKVAVFIGKCVSRISRIFGFGAGATWPGEIALWISPEIFRPLVQQFSRGVILIAGTNGKTTTSLMLKTILHFEKLRIVHNTSGANLLNGLVSVCLQAANIRSQLHADWGVFEVDENSLPFILRYITPKYIVILNLFRDQLDRYGEVDIIAEKWHKAIALLSDDTTLILNADDPLVSSLGAKSKAQSVYFGLSQKSDQSAGIDHATDSIFCLSCGSRLSYNTYYFSHLGDWYCQVCGNKRPRLTITNWDSALPGLYNKYNTLASVLTAQLLGIHNNRIQKALSGFAPAFGRQEECMSDGKTVKLFLSKNPAGFNASLRAVLEMKPAVILLALNDRIPDGRDVSWIWDVDFEMIPENTTVVVSGDRAYDLALRLQYSNHQQKSDTLMVETDPEAAIRTGLSKLQKNETLYVLPTYSAMLDIRKILTGRKIL